MAMPDTTRPLDEGGPEDFKDGDEPLIGNDASDPVETAPGELELGEDDVRLPWLEGEDEEEEYRGGGGQIAMLAFLAFAVLALIVGGIWWFTREKRDETMVADGGVIEAPAQPYKQKPANPGGMTYQGTGDTSFAVSEGKTRPARLEDDSQAPRPGFDAVAGKDKAAPASSADKTPASGKANASVAESAPASGPAVQVGAYTNREAAEAGWNRLSSQHAVLKGLHYRVAEGRAEFGKVYRLQVLPGDLAAARKLCSTLKSAGQDCAVKN